MNLKLAGNWFIPNSNITDPLVAKQLGYNVTVTAHTSTSQADLYNANLD